MTLLTPVLFAVLIALTVFVVKVCGWKETVE